MKRTVCFCWNRRLFSFLKNSSLTLLLPDSGRWTCLLHLRKEYWLGFCSNGRDFKKSPLKKRFKNHNSKVNWLGHNVCSGHIQPSSLHVAKNAAIIFSSRTFNSYFPQIENDWWLSEGTNTPRRKQPSVFKVKVWSMNCCELLQAERVCFDLSMTHFNCTIDILMLARM